MDLGARPGRVFVAITLPLIVPAIASGWLLSFTLSWDDLVITQFVAGPGSSTLPMVIFSKVRLGVSPDVNALATIMVLLVATGIVISHRVDALQSRAARTRPAAGRGRQSVRANAMTQNVLGIDVGGSSVKAGVVDVATGRLLGELISAPTPQPSTPRRSGGSSRDWPRACRGAGHRRDCLPQRRHSMASCAPPRTSTIPGWAPTARRSWARTQPAGGVPERCRRGGACRDALGRGHASAPARSSC